MERVCVFIDGSGFYFALKRNNHHTRVDYHELSKALVGPDRELVRTYYYNSTHDPLMAPEQYKSQQPFLESLMRTPFLELRLGRLVPIQEGGFKEKGVNVRFAADLVYYAGRKLFDTAVVVTEDTDFSHALNEVKELGRHVEMCLFPDNQPRELVQIADALVPIEKVLDMYADKIFPQAEEDNIGNRMEDIPTKKHPPKNGFLNGLKAKLK